MRNKPLNTGESLWRRKLSAAERAALRPQPELELEAQLTAALAKIPAPAVSSNFTARVLNAVDFEEARAARSLWRWNWRALLPRIAVAAAVTIFAVISVPRYEASSQRAALVRNVAQVAAAQPLPSVEALNNFDVIQRMSQRADDQLLALLQ